MPHDLKTRTIDYREESPPDWATPEEKVNFWPRRAARFMCDEIDRVEKKLAAEKAAAGNEVSGL